VVDTLLGAYTELIEQANGTVTGIRGPKVDVLMDDGSTTGPNHMEHSSTRVREIPHGSLRTGTERHRLAQLTSVF